MKGNDTYPIVTLSEGHTKIISKFESLQDGQELAKQYANMLDSRIRKHYDLRLKQSWKTLTTFAITGTWIEEEASFLY